MAFDIYQVVTDKILTALENGTVPWRRPFAQADTRNQYPRNFVSKKAYRGVNIFLLAVEVDCRGYQHNLWLSFKQAQDLGGKVRKGEKATMVVFWTMVDVEEKGEKKKIPVLRYYNVFNVAQCEGLKLPEIPQVVGNDPNGEAEKIIAGYKDGPVLGETVDKAYYQPLTDTVYMPKIGGFISADDYYSTYFHELVHSTGHDTRLNRGLTKLAAFGSECYGKEELVAEMGAAFLCAFAGINNTIENSAAYLANWIKAIKGDKRLVVSAAGAAQKAADRIIGVNFEEN